ncbi:MAG: carboxymuconolactone decarboxylase family protein [Pseudomonadota bacterium]
MSVVRLLDDESLSPEAKAVFDDIRAARGSDFINNFWRALAHDPAHLRRVWETLKATMAPGALDPATKELLYIAVSATNGCSYCVHSHTAAARAKGLSEAQLQEAWAVIGMAGQTNALATALQIEVDREFLVDDEE